VPQPDSAAASVCTAGTRFLDLVVTVAQRRGAALMLRTAYCQGKERCQRCQKPKLAVHAVVPKRLGTVPVPALHSSRIGSDPVYG